MDINCTYDCAHQAEGKCGLTRLPQGGLTSLAAGAWEAADCIYYQRKDELY